MNTRSRAGFSLLELMIVIAIIASLSSLFAVHAQALRLSAHEMSALAGLRAIHLAETQFVAQVAVDVDRDGIGEYGYLAELAGTVDLREYSSGRVPRAAFRESERRRATTLSESFGHIYGGVAERDGYFFQLWLPDVDGRGIPEEQSGGAQDSRPPDADGAESRWCAYAWPSVAGATGNRVFFVREDGQVFFMGNRAATGPTSTPDFDAAYATDNMSSAPGLAGAVDGQSWHALN